MTETLSIDDALKKLKLEAQQTLQKVLKDNKDKWEADILSKQQHILQKIDPQFVKLNVGGKKFVTTKTVLSNIKDTKLERLVNGKYPIMLDDKGRIFLDRNGEYFGYVLDCLRQGKIETPSDPYLSRRLQAEFEYFELVDKKEPEKKVVIEEVKSNTQETGTLTGGLFSDPLAKKKIEFVVKPIEGKLDWKLALAEIAIQDGITTDGKTVKTDLCGQLIGSHKFTSGVHQWRFVVDKFESNLSSKFDEDFGEVVFGVVHGDTWDKIKEIGDMTGCCGFTTTGEVLKGVTFDDNDIAGLAQADGPSMIEEILLNKQEITLTFDMEKGTLKMKQTSSGTEYTLNIKNTGNGVYFPYFFVENASLTLLEASSSTTLVENIVPKDTNNKKVIGSGSSSYLSEDEGVADEWESCEEDAKW